MRRGSRNPTNHSSRLNIGASTMSASAGRQPDGDIAPRHMEVEYVYLCRDEGPEGRCYHHSIRRADMVKCFARTMMLVLTLALGSIASQATVLLIDGIDADSRSATERPKLPGRWPTSRRRSAARATSRSGRPTERSRAGTTRPLGLREQPRDPRVATLSERSTCSSRPAALRREPCMATLNTARWARLQHTVKPRRHTGAHTETP